MTKDEILDRVKTLWTLAELRDRENGVRGEYELEVGQNIYNVLVTSQEVIHHATLISTLVGIPVRINVVDPDVLKLWEEVK